MTTPQTSQKDVKDEIWFWFLMGMFMLISIIGMIGNGLVIYVANQNLKTGPIRHLNKVVRNLAITDFMWNILGVPVFMIYWIISWVSSKTWTQLR